MTLLFLYFQFWHKAKRNAFSEVVISDLKGGFDFNNDFGETRAILLAQIGPVWSLAWLSVYEHRAQFKGDVMTSFWGMDSTLKIYIVFQKVSHRLLRISLNIKIKASIVRHTVLFPILTLYPAKTGSHVSCF